MFTGVFAYWHRQPDARYAESSRKPADPAASHGAKEVSTVNRQAEPG